MKYLFCLCLVFFHLVVRAQNPSIKVFYEKANGNVHQFYASNPHYCPYTVEVRFTTFSGMESSVQLPYKVLVPAQTEKEFLFTIQPIPQRSWEFNYRYFWWRGDVQQIDYDKNHVYFLPYEANTTQKVIQGYNGSYSHQNQYAVDFKMNEGTKICAARGGVVVEIKEDSNQRGEGQAFVNDGNYVLIYHSDGTFGSYYHLQQNGALVSPGDEVEAGEVIGLSGHTGWSSTPHLHFEVYLNRDKQRQTIPTKFLTGKQMTSELKQGQTYTSQK